MACAIPVFKKDESDWHYLRQVYQAGWEREPKSFHHDDETYFCDAAGTGGGGTVMVSARRFRRVEKVCEEGSPLLFRRQLLLDFVDQQRTL